MPFGDGRVDSDARKKVYDAIRAAPDHGFADRPAVAEMPTNAKGTERQQLASAIPDEPLQQQHGCTRLGLRTIARACLCLLRHLNQISTSSTYRMHQECFRLTKRPSSRDTHTSCQKCHLAYLSHSTHTFNTQSLSICNLEQYSLHAASSSFA